jgi:hypothetical protein
MTVTIRVPGFRIRRDPPRTSSNGRKPKLRPRAGAPGRQRAGRSAGAIDRLFYVLFLLLPVITLLQTVLARTGDAAIRAVPQEAVPQETVLSGPQWAYTVPFGVENKADIEKLIQCESRGLNVSGPDSDGIISDGILQFHRGPTDTLTSSTWEDFSRASGISGSPMVPADAIRMADWAISHGLGHRWTCWRLQGLPDGVH